MTEGCEGGWPHFNSYFAENGHMVSEECAPYMGVTLGQKCSTFAQCKPVAKVSKSYDVGGAYGQSSEEHMMKEIIRNGALNTEFQAPGIFGTYKEGLISEAGIAGLHALTQKETEGLHAKDVSAETLAGEGYAWTNLNHSVLIVGWGVTDDGQKHWVVRNSYGPNWGMSGDFLMRRGHDDFGFESEQASFEPEML